jgi:hypothetical protein
MVNAQNFRRVSIASTAGAEQHDKIQGSIMGVGNLNSEKERIAKLQEDAEKKGYKFNEEDLKNAKSDPSKSRSRDRKASQMTLSLQTDKLRKLLPKKVENQTNPSHLDAAPSLNKRRVRPNPSVMPDVAEEESSFKKEDVKNKKSSAWGDDDSLNTVEAPGADDGTGGEGKDRKNGKKGKKGKAPKVKKGTSKSALLVLKDKDQLAEAIAESRKVTHTTLPPEGISSPKLTRKKTFPDEDVVI